ncbi:MAG TPA: hypothetical protein VGG65_04835 [Thermoanaerobaculia bacterium]
MFGSLREATLLGVEPRAVAATAGDARCLNETCPRCVDDGLLYCAACHLERELFWRDKRSRPATRL